MKKQKGYILPLVLILLTAMIAGSAAFFGRANDSASMSALQRDHDLAVTLAESGANRVLGLYYNDDATPRAVASCGVSTMIGDMNCDTLHDNPQSKPDSLNPTLPLPLAYEFFLTSSNGLTESAPGILQMIANGEARNVSTPAANQSISTTTTRMKVSDLFVSASVSPLLFTNGSGGLVRSSNSWSAETSEEKVAVFLEATRNPDPLKSTWIDLYINSVARVGTSRAYVLRYIGSFTDTWAGAIPAPISESATHG